MTYEEFVLKVRNCLQEDFAPFGSVEIRTACKNNGKQRTGISFCEDGDSIAPIIYLEEYFEKYEAGVPMEQILLEVRALYESIKVEHRWEGNFVMDYKNVKDRIIYKLVNRQKNKDLLKEIPHIPYLDLAIVFCVLVETDMEEGKIATMLIRSEHLKYWDVTEGEIYRRAFENTEKLLPADLQTLCAILEETPEFEGEDTKKGECMYVLSNRLRNFGAATILYEDRLKIIRMCFGENFYILPSSIHEVILLPESHAMEKEELAKIVKDINETQVKEEEVLSDLAYYFDGEKVVM